MQLCFAHRAFQAEQQAVVEVARIVEPVLVEDEGLGQGADLEQAMPLRGVAGQPRHLQAKHDAHLAHADRRHQLLEAFPVGRSS